MPNYAVQEQNQDMVSLLSAYFRLLYNPVHAFADSVNMMQMLPGNVGTWPGSGIGGGSTTLDSITDKSGNGLHLARNGSAIMSANTSIGGLCPHMSFNGTTGYFNHADAAIFDILGTETISGSPGLSIGGWFRFNAIGAGEFLMTKWLTTGNQRSYNINKTSGDLARFSVSSNGTATTTVDSVSSMSVSTWYFIVGRFTPSTELAIFLNDEKTTNVTSIPASIFNSTSEFRIGVDGGGVAFFGGRSALCFLCAAAVPDIFINTFYQMTAPLFGISV